MATSENRLYLDSEGNPTDKTSTTPITGDLSQGLADSGYVPTSGVNSAMLSPTPDINPNTYTEPPISDISNIDYSPVVPMGDEQTRANSMSTELENLYNQTLGQSAYTAQQEQAQGIQDKITTQRDLETQLKTIINEQKAIPLMIQEESVGRGRTAGGVAPIEASRLRKNAIQALSVNSLLEASRGNLATAYELVDRAVKQKFDPIYEQINVKTKNLELIRSSEAYTKEQRDEAQKQIDLQNAKLKATQDQEAKEKEIQSIAVQAAQAGVDALTLNKIRNAKDIVEATQLAQGAGVYKVAEKEKDLIEVSPGTSIFDPNTGEFIGTAPEKPTDPKDMIQVVGDSLLQYDEQMGSWETVYTKPKDATPDDLSVNDKLDLKEKGYEMNENGELIKVSATPQEKIDKANKVLDAVNEVQSLDWGSVVGAIQGKTPEILMTGNQANINSKIAQLKSLLTLENMGIMKGVLSDSDMKVITNASTALNRATTEEAFDKELKRIRYAAKSLLNSDKLQIGQVINNNDGTYTYKNLDGTAHTGEMGDNYADNTRPILDLDFNQVGSDTNKALPEKVALATPGEQGGQCGRFVNQATGLGLGDSYQSKIAKMDDSINYPEPGMVFVIPYADTGHTGFILSVNHDKGTVTVKDSNYSLDEKVKVHEIPINKITGLRRINNLA